MDQKWAEMRYVSNIDNKRFDIEWKWTETSKEVISGTGSGHKQTGSGQKWSRKGQENNQKWVKLRYISNFEATVTILNTMKFEAFCGISFYPYTPHAQGHWQRGHGLIMRLQYSNL